MEDFEGRFMVEVTGLSPETSWEDVYQFFLNCGNIRHLEITRATHSDKFVSSPEEAVTVVQQVVQSMIVKGYVLSKDAFSKAKAFDESHQVSSTAAAKVAELSKNIGLTDKIHSGVEAVRSVDEKYHVSETTKSVASYTGKTAVAATSAVVNSRYFAKGALWFSGVLDRASKAAADLGTRGVQK